MDSLSNQPHRKAVRSSLKHLPKGLDDTYDDAMRRIGSQVEEDVDLAHRTLSWITHARRPLNVSEFQHALAIEPGENSIDNDCLIDEALLVSVCAGLVTVDQESDIIRLVHYTAQEYFKRTCEQHFPDAEQQISASCITYLSFDVFDEGYCWFDGVFAIRLQRYPFLKYAAQYWGHHSHGTIQQTVMDSALEFLSNDNKASGAGQVLLLLDRECWFQCHEAPELRGVHLAAFFGLEIFMVALLEKAVDIEAKDDNRKSALHWAVERQHPAIVQLIIEKGADVNAKDKYGNTALHIAISKGDDSMVLLLIENGAYIKAEGSRGYTPLHTAALMGYKAVVQLLIEKGANIEAMNESGRTAFHLAVLTGDEAVVRLLIEKGIDVEANDIVGDTGLHVASYQGIETIVQELIGKAEMGAKNSRGDTALHLASSQGHDAAVRVLMENANIEVKNNNGDTALHLAAGNGHLKVVQLLLGKASIEAKSSNGRTALHKAAYGGHELVAQLLIDSGADVEAKDHNGWTALHWAVYWGYRKNAVVQLLIGKANIHATTNAEETALHIAAENGYEAVAHLLIENNANVEAKTENGNTALHLASHNGHEAVARLLIAKADMEVKDG